MSKSKDPTPPEKEKSKFSSLIKRMKDVIKAAVFMGEEKGEAFVRSHAEQVFIQAHGSGKSQELESEEAKRKTEDALKKSKAAEKVLQDTPQSVLNVTEDGEGGYTRKSIWKWRPQDIWLAVMLFIWVLVMMATSITNVQINIMAGAPTVFMNAEWKSWLIAMLAGAGALLFKMLPMVFARASHQELAKRTLIAITIIMTIVWIWAFSERFQGMGAKPNLTALLINTEVSAFKDAFVFIQILTELLISACLFTWLQTIWDRYLPYTLNPNPAHPLVLEHSEQADICYEKIFARKKKSEDEWSVYQSDKQAFINEQVAAFAMAVARNQSLYS